MSIKAYIDMSIKSEENNLVFFCIVNDSIS